MTDARLDLDRTRRIDLPEAVYCQHKTVDQCVAIVAELLVEGTDAIVATRATEAQGQALAELDPCAAEGSTLTWRHRPSSGRRATLVAAGTSDLPVAREC
ncbi:MAG: 1-(5-phosphoribosyl)-5-amino-4-imidazole-carboxylate carboxylase, partial [Actinomycetia bacterium]|nr:1-(5-phosphoribosyl)-5-amino-4-imidazole-carboxylate carboxylase [Actinomycetes bacterium]